ncbi:MAG TPA: CpcT/CpeT family chromophore lyase [Xanthomonadaceae bacterium]|nr:CpcT/CpeT family chromophore lyase [Xanthomonadaceae bacterium]
MPAWGLDVDTVVGRLVGEFTAPAEGDGAAQHAVHAEVRVRAIDGRVVFMQWREQGEGDEPGELTRQRLWSVVEDGDGVVLRFFTFHDHAPYVDLHKKPLIAMALRSEDLRAYPDSCAVRLRDVDGRIGGSVAASDCRLDTDAYGRNLSLEYALELDAEGFEFHEGAFQADGSLAFRMPESGAYRFRRR